MKTQTTILVAPLYWGLGHAARCIPIIKALLANHFNVLLGSDGEALLLLRKEFPELPYVTLPSYEISYPKKGTWFKTKLLLQLPHIKNTIRAERLVVERLISEEKIQGIISDNRMGVRSNKVPSVYITHQINVLSRTTTYFSSKIHQKIIQKFDVCWVPDVEGSVNLSGILGHPKKMLFPIQYIGPLSRFEKRKEERRYDFIVLISGPEPQRSLFEEITTQLFKKSEKKVLLIRGVVEDHIKVETAGNLTIQNYMTSAQLELAINQSNAVISRSGYTTIMDLATLEKPAFFIPTPGQYEQKYLAKLLKIKKIAPYCEQENFTLEKLDEIPLFTGFKSFKHATNFSELFALFQRK